MVKDFRYPTSSIRFNSLIPFVVGILLYLPYAGAIHTKNLINNNEFVLCGHSHMGLMDVFCGSLISFTKSEELKG